MTHTDHRLRPYQAFSIIPGMSARNEAPRATTACYCSSRGTGASLRGPRDEAIAPVWPTLSSVFAH